MRVMILVGGRGSRLGSLTDETPKPMLPIGGKPLLEHTIEQLKDCGFTEIVMNPVYLGHVITTHFVYGDRFGVRIRYSPETELLGTAGAVRKAEKLLSRSLSTMVLYGDNYYGDLDFFEIAREHLCHRNDGTLGLYSVNQESHPSKVWLSTTGKVSGFVEKPAPQPHHIFSGIMMIDPELISDIPEDAACDFGGCIIPHWIRKGRSIGSYFSPITPIDIGTKEGYIRANEAYNNRSHGW